MTPSQRQEADLISAAVDLGAIPPECADVQPYHLEDLSCRTVWAILQRLPAPFRVETVLDELDHVKDWRAPEAPAMWFSELCLYHPTSADTTSAAKAILARHRARTVALAAEALSQAPDSPEAWDRLLELRSHQQPSRNGHWPPPQPLPPLMPSLPDIAPEIIPEALRQWVIDGARSICVPVSGIAAGIMVVLSSILGRGVRILPEPGNNWAVTPNLWGAIVAPPGMLKSAVISYISAPLEPLIRAANEHNRHLAAEVKARRSIVETAIKAEQKKKSGADVQTLTELHEEFDEIRAGIRRYIIQDCTPEKLGELQMDNPRGLLQLRDELTGWLCSLSKTGREQERVYYLEGWDGDKSSTVDRIVRGSLYIESNCLSLFGAIQPSRLAPLVEGVMSGLADDGLLQRLQCLVYVDSLPPWVSTPPPPSEAARARVEALVATVDSISEYANPRTMVFSRRAQALWEGWRGELESRIRNPATPQRLVAHVSKYRSMVPSLAAIAHVTHSVDTSDSGTRTICDACLSQAIAWAEYLELHAAHLYQISTPGMDSVHALAKAIRAGTVTSGMSLRDIHRHHWARLDTPESVAQAAGTLEGIGWVRVQAVSRGGRPAQILEVSPRV